MLGIRTVVSSALGLDIRDRGMVSIACHCGLFPHFLLIQDFVVGLNENLGWASRVIPCRSKRGKCDSVRSFYRMVELLITAFFPKPADMTRLDSIFKAATTSFLLKTIGCLQ